jgi:DNA repair exonuclease SbcCD ATPase subunit
MKHNFLLSSGSCLLLLLCSVALGQSESKPAITPENSPGGQPVSYASVTQLNGVLAQLEGASQKTQEDLSKLRIERWKADSKYKKQALGNVDSIQRNLQSALPEMITQLRSAPEDLSASFKLYRNLDALYDVLGNVTEDAGAFGSKDDVQALSNDLNAFEGSRKQLGERIENLSSTKESELTRLRTQLKALQAEVQAAPPKKVVVDDTEPQKKAASSAKKKAAPKKAITLDTPKAAAKKSADTAKPSSGQQGSQPQQPNPNPTKPQ